MNIPGLSERTLRRDIASTDFSTEPKIQVCMYVECIFSMLMEFYR